ncbi:hypothetical protein [Mycetocola saprophilus]|uniref:hypothetical protein n=1 Tax=Mycetocola saprophilus TaxID=76636 RepID=UPI003BF1F6B1
MLPETKFATIVGGLHPARFDPYLVAADGHPHRALELYLWNVQLAGAWHETLALTEVFLRNRIDRELRIWNVSRPPSGPEPPFTELWTERAARPLNTILRVPLDRAVRNAVRSRNRRGPDHPRGRAPIDHNDLVSQLTFGVFVNLLPARNADSRNSLQRDILWREALSSGFPHRGSGATDGRALGTQATRLHALRNRVAHAEPLLDVRSDRRLRDVGRLLASMDPRFAGWVTGGSRVQDVLKQRPG